MLKLQAENRFKVIDKLSDEVKALLGLDDKASPSPDEPEKVICDVEPKKFIRRAEWVGLGQENDFCGKKFSINTCRREMHDYASAIFCGREWHEEVCGADGSWMHYRRVSRMAWRIFWLGSQSKAFGLGYWVFTIPSQIRDKFRKQSVLRRADKFLMRLLKECGFEESVSRWHWFGDGKIVEGELELGEYHPHLNILVAGRYMRDDELNRIRDAWRRYLEVMSGESIDAVNIHYQYFKEPSQWMHKAKYVCRATFKRLKGNEELALALYRFRNSHYVGFGRGTELEKKKAHGQALYEIWKSDSRDEIAEDVKEHDKSVGDYRVICEECAKEGIYSRLYAKQTLEGFRMVVSMEELAPRIEREIHFGFYLLKDIILKDKPMSEEVEDGELVYEGYDTS